MSTEKIFNAVMAQLEERNLKIKEYSDIVDRIGQVLEFPIGLDPSQGKHRVTSDIWSIDTHGDVYVKAGDRTLYVKCFVGDNFDNYSPEKLMKAFVDWAENKYKLGYKELVGE